MKLLLKIAVAAVVVIGGYALIVSQQGGRHYTDAVGGGVSVLPKADSAAPAPPVPMAPAPVITVPAGPPAPTGEKRVAPTPSSGTAPLAPEPVPATHVPAGTPQKGAADVVPGSGSDGTQPLPGDPGFPEGPSLLDLLPVYTGCVTAAGVPTLCPGQVPLPPPNPPRTLPLP